MHAAQRSLWLLLAAVLSKHTASLRLLQDVDSQNYQQDARDLSTQLKDLGEENDELRRQLEDAQTELESTTRQLAQCSSESKQLSEKAKGQEELSVILLNDKYNDRVSLNETKTALEACRADTRKTELLYYQCRTGSHNYKSSCKELRLAGYLESGHYVIDPDGLGGVQEFHVECDMNEGKGEPATVIHHNTEQRHNARSDNYGARTYTRHVIYQASMAQIAALIKKSKHCAQSIRYECFNSRFHHKGTTYIDWFSRDGRRMESWGEAPPGSRMCSCGFHNSCDKPGLMCNCDAYDGVWRTDSGEIVDNQNLPVTKMAFGGLTGKEKGYHTLGPLYCYG